MTRVLDNMQVVESRCITCILLAVLSITWIATVFGYTIVIIIKHLRLLFIWVFARSETCACFYTSFSRMTYLFLAYPFVRQHTRQIELTLFLFHVMRDAWACLMRCIWIQPGKVSSISMYMLSSPLSIHTWHKYNGLYGSAEGLKNTYMYRTLVYAKWKWKFHRRQNSAPSPAQ